MGISEKQLEEMVGKDRAQKLLQGEQPKKQKKPSPVRPATRPQEPNQTELEYRTRYLDPRPDVISVRYEAISFRLAKGRIYTPDWIVTTESHLEVHEVKGPYERRDGRTRWAVAADLWPEFAWIYAQKLKGGEWKVQRDGDEP